jgi:hypothetical protein
MLTLKPLGFMAPTLTVRYEPEYERWRYVKEVVAPALGHGLEEGTLAHVALVHKGKVWAFGNKRDQLKDFIEDGASIWYVPRVIAGVRWEVVHGNACANGGDADGCPICLESSFDVSLRCYHRFHMACLARSGTERCPTCRQSLLGPEYYGDMS